MMNRQHGLTMIEVLAAMVIFTAGAVILFSWIGQTTDRLGRLSQEQAVLFDELIAIDYLRTLNPALLPNGESTIGGAAFRWEAVPVGAERPVRTPAGELGIYVAQLYEVRLQVRPDQASQTERKLLLAGWRQVRPAQAATPFSLVPATPAPAAQPAGDAR